jgi:hypothetical protein
MLSFIPAEIYSGYIPYYALSINDHNNSIVRGVHRVSVSKRGMQNYKDNVYLKLRLQGERITCS